MQEIISVNEALCDLVCQKKLTRSQNGLYITFECCWIEKKTSVILFWSIDILMILAATPVLCDDPS